MFYFKMVKILKLIGLLWCRNPIVPNYMIKSTAVILAYQFDTKFSSKCK